MVLPLKMHSLLNFYLVTKVPVHRDFWFNLDQFSSKHKLNSFSFKIVIYGQLEASRDT